MTAEREHSEFLEDILETVEKIDSFIAGQTKESFRANDKKVFAVIRGLDTRRSQGG